MFNFFHNFAPNPIFFQYNFINIHWYGLILALALISTVALGFYLVKKRGLKTDDLLDLALWLVIGGIVGSRLYDVLIIDWAYFSRHLIEIFYIWQGGLAIHGAIIGGGLALYLWRRSKKQTVWPWLDIIAVVLPLGQAIGRWGNYFNSELFGGPTNLPWGIWIAENLRPLIYKTEQYFHPAFLYESILNLVLFVALFILYKKQRLKSGRYFGIYLIGYGLIRFVMEFIRVDVTAMLFGIRLPQIASVLLIIIGLIIIRIKSK